MGFRRSSKIAPTLPEATARDLGTLRERGRGRGWTVAGSKTHSSCGKAGAARRGTVRRHTGDEACRGAAASRLGLPSEHQAEGQGRTIKRQLTITIEW